MSLRSSRNRLVVVIAFAAAVTAAAQTRTTDWTQWRGPNRDGALAAFTPAMARPDPVRRVCGVPAAEGVAGLAHAQMEGGRRTRLRVPDSRQQPRLRVLA